MRPTILAALLLALGTRGWSDESGDRPRFGLQLALDDSATRLTPAPSRIVEQSERPPNVLREGASADNLRRSERRADNVSGSAAPDNVVSAREQRGNVVRLKESAPIRMPSPRDRTPVFKPSADEPLALRPAMTMAPPKPQPPATPDERPLWRLLEERRYAILNYRLERLRAAYPGWQPPARLVSLIREGVLRKRIEDRIEAKDAASLIAVAAQHPEAFSCGNIAFAWALADAHAGLKQSAEAEETARRLLACPNEEDRLATIYKARSWLAAERWEQLLVQEEAMARSAQGEEKFRLVRYHHRLGQFVSASGKGNRREAEQLFAALANDIDGRQDFSAALLGAWNHYQAADYENATRWFTKVLRWNPAQYEAHRGLALCALQEKRHEAALSHAQALPEQAAGRAELLRDVRVAQAQLAYGAGRHDDSLSLLDAARAQAELPRHAQLLAAWSNSGLGRQDAAADEFIRLYRETPDLESAQGILNSMSGAGRDEELHALAQAEPLAGLVRRHDAERAFADKRFLLARTLEPERYAGRGAPAVPQLALSSASRSKSGTAGLSRLDLQWQPAIEAALPAGASGELRVRVERVRLDSGSLPDNAPVGSFPLLPAAYTTRPTTETKGWQPRLLWHDEGSRVLDAEIGLTPSGGSVPAQWTGRLACQGRSGEHHWRLDAYREPVRESILSYTGLRDPYQGEAWGRVLRNGALGGMRVHVSERWTLNAQANIELLTGRQVADNRRFAADAGLAYNFRPAGFDYAVLSAGVSTDRYSRNLSQFTVGHGGYFSPQRYWRIGPSFDFMTEENRSFMVKGRISAGRTGKREQAAPFFPLSPDGRSYAGSSGTGGAYDVELSAIWRVSDHVQLGATFAKRHSPQYSDHAAMGFVRILFEPSKAVLSSDLRALSSKELY